MFHPRVSRANGVLICPANEEPNGPELCAAVAALNHVAVDARQTWRIASPVSVLQKEFELPSPESTGTS